MRCNGSWQPVPKCCQNPESAAFWAGQGPDIGVRFSRRLGCQQIWWRGLRIPALTKLPWLNEKNISLTTWGPWIKMTDFLSAQECVFFFMIPFAIPSWKFAPHMKFISPSIPSLLAQQLSILNTGKRPVGFYWSAALPSDSPLPTLILSRLLRWDRVIMASHFSCMIPLDLLNTSTRNRATQVTLIWSYTVMIYDIRTWTS